jgi:sugar phosphate isomerase/epimerase
MLGGLSRKCSESDFEFWANLDIDFMMLSIAWDFFLDDRNVSNVIELKRSYGMNILIHPRPDGKTLLSPAYPSSHHQIFIALRVILDLIVEHDLIPKLIIHPATYMIPNSSYPVFSEDDAFSSAVSFYQRLRQYSDVSFALENVYPPGIGWEEIGYDPSHFSLIDPDGFFEFCLDTGHLNLSPFGLMDFLALPNELTCMHIQSNNGVSDQHLPLTRSNFSEWSLLSKHITQDKYIVVEVKQGLENVRRIVEQLRHNEIAAY